jgi:hypothetical protein
MRRAAGAACVYLVLTLWVLRDVLPAPASRFAFPSLIIGTIREPVWLRDLHMVTWQIARNARTWATHPQALFAGEQCYPSPDSIALGEHMLGSGLLGVPAHVLGADPVVVYNTVAGLVLWLGAMAGYAAVFSWTRSAGAALVGGLLVGFHPLRINNPLHPYLMAYQGTALALLFAHRLFIRRRWMDAVGLALAISMQLLESLYAVLALMLLGGVYGVWLAVIHRHALTALIPKLLLVVLVSVTTATLVFKPYIETQAAWGILADRGALLLTPHDLWFGHPWYPGSVTLILAAIALIDRARRGAVRGDPRLVLAVGAVVTLWASVAAFDIPWLNFRVPSLFGLLSSIVPGLSAVREPRFVFGGACLALTLLAGCGVARLLAGRARMIRVTLVVGVMVAALAEVFYAPLATATFGVLVGDTGVPGPPDSELVAAIRAAGEGAVLDLPFHATDKAAAAHALSLATFHRRPVAACYDSFITPIQTEIERLAAELPASGAIDALFALGFRTAIVHEEFLGANDLRLRRLVAEAPSKVGSDQLVRSGRIGSHVLFGLASTRPIVAEFDALTPQQPVADIEPVNVAPQGVPALRQRVPLIFRNWGDGTFLHPQPLLPTALTIRWDDQSGVTVLQATVRILLPLALPRGAAVKQTIKMPTPHVSGEYLVTAALAAQPEVVVSANVVRVREREDKNDRGS